MIYLELFYTFFKIGLFCFGGGYAMLSLIQDEVVHHNGWLTMESFSDIVAVSQMTPGPIAINTATYVGYTASGGNVLGSIMATLALIIPSVVMMSIVIRAYKKFSQNKASGDIQRNPPRCGRVDRCCSTEHGHTGKFCGLPELPAFFGQFPGCLFLQGSSHFAHGSGRICRIFDVLTFFSKFVAYNYSYAIQTQGAVCTYGRPAAGY